MPADPATVDRSKTKEPAEENERTLQEGAPGEEEWYVYDAMLLIHKLRHCSARALLHIISFTSKTNVYYNPSFACTGPNLTRIPLLSTRSRTIRRRKSNCARSPALICVPFIALGLAFSWPS
jgi:hypothetical protein